MPNDRPDSNERRDTKDPMMDVEQSYDTKVQVDMNANGIQKDEAAQAMGRKGGKARAASMTAEQRAAIARKAAAVRWSK